MAGMRHNVPGEFKNETKWLKYFSTKQVCFLGVALFITSLCYKASVALGGSGFPGVMVGLVIGFFILLPVLIKIPETEYLRGGGLYVSELFARLWIRKHTKKIYVKGWGKD